MALSPKQQRFVEEYLVDLNATQAAIRAGYSPKTAEQQGPRLLGKVGVAQAIAEGVAARSQRTAIDADRVVRELARIGLADLRRLMTWDGEAVRFRPSDELTEDEAAAIAAVESETITRTDEDGSTETKVKLKLRLWDKNAALTNLGRHLGMFVDKTEHSGKVETGPPVLEVIVKRSDAA